MLETFTVALRGELFTLYREQIEFDSPNYFSALFLGDFAEAHTRTVELTRSPGLFRIIVEYMSGYSVLPIASDLCVPGMSADTVLENLRRDAEFYGLDGLVAQLDPALPEHSLAICRAYGVAEQSVRFEDVLDGHLPPGVTVDHRGVGVSAGANWQPIAIRASGLLLLQVWPHWRITDPLNHHRLGAVLPGESTSTCIVDQHVLSALPAVIPNTAHTGVDGTDLSPDELQKVWDHVWTGRGYPNAAYAALKRVHDTENAIVLWADEIVFSITRIQFGDPAVVASELGARVLAAKLVSRATATRRLVEGPSTSI